MSAFPLRTCSACAGDYEDPDRTAPVDDDEADGSVYYVSSDADHDESGELREERTEPRTGAETQEDEFLGP